MILRRSSTLREPSGIEAEPGELPAAVLGVVDEQAAYRGPRDGPRERETLELVLHRLHRGTPDRLRSSDAQILADETTPGSPGRSGHSRLASPAWRSRSRTTPCSATPARAPWSGGTARSTGSACRGSTRPPASRPCSAAQARSMADRPRRGQATYDPGATSATPSSSRPCTRPRPGPCGSPT